MLLHGKISARATAAVASFAVGAVAIALFVLLVRAGIDWDMPVAGLSPGNAVALEFLALALTALPFLIGIAVKLPMRKIFGVLCWMVAITAFIWIAWVGRHTPPLNRQLWCALGAYLVFAYVGFLLVLSKPRET